MTFYSRFKYFKVKVIGDKETGWVVKNKIPKNIEYIDTSLYPALFFDPWTYFGGIPQAHRSFQFVKNLKNYVKDCNVINISDLFYFYCWQSAILSAKLGKKLVVIVWETLPHHPSSYIPPYCFGVRKVLRTTDLFIARSYKAKEYLVSIGADKEKIKVIYKGIDTSVFRPGERKKLNKKLRILYVGQLVESKGVLNLLEAFDKLCSEYDNLELVLSGRSKGEQLERKIKDLSQRLPIVLSSKVDYNLMPDLYRSSDIYCHLSQDWKYLGIINGGNDWFPYAIIEAMATGLPVVATRVGAISEQLGNVGNIMVDQKDTESAYSGLKRMIEDSKLRFKVGKRNRDRCLRMFDIKTQAHKTEEAILKIV